MITPTIGDRVRMSTKHLRSSGQYTGPEAPTSYGPFARGVVIAAQPFGGPGHELLTVKWDDGDTHPVLDVNLEGEHAPVH